MKETISRMKRLGIVMLFAVASLALPVQGQGAKLQLNNLEKLSHKASEVVDVTLDGPMLQFASKFLDDKDEDEVKAKALLKGLEGVYVKSFEFDKDDEYSAEDVEAIRAQLNGPGWSKMVEARSKRSHEIDEVFVMKAGDKIGGIAVLVADARELTVVNIVGTIDPNQIRELADHFEPNHEQSKHKKDKEHKGEKD
ncbi:MAG TPA: DUF4252 domain-containing protein [Candidatus Angelobacter sp.]|nr:DUF4252 domain-containing protein [Candidatus Angelobacter sp.]